MWKDEKGEPYHFTGRLKSSCASAGTRVQQKQLPGSDLVLPIVMKEEFPLLVNTGLSCYLVIKEDFDLAAMPLRR